MSDEQEEDIIITKANKLIKKARVHEKSAHIKESLNLYQECATLLKGNCIDESLEGKLEKKIKKLKVCFLCFLLSSNSLRNILHLFS
jgi:hypothetical protein